MLLLDPFGDAPGGTPMLICDGSDAALLLRSATSAHLLKGITPEGREALEGAVDILVVERGKDEVVRDYMALVKRVDDVRGLIEERG